MAMLKIKKLGQIREANLSFGDLTVLVGPQATGKSIALQLLKLILDGGKVQDVMGNYGLDWGHKLPEFLDVYFGEGMRSIWREGMSSIEWEGKPVDLPGMAKRKRRTKEETLFFIPAQRVLALRDGWPRPFTDYAPGDPFAVREFSEKLRVLVEQEFGGSDLFPQERRLKREFRELLQRHVFSEYHLKVDKVRSQKRLVLGSSGRAEPLPYMVWSAGQREFVPLLLGFYWLMPSTKISTRDAIKWVVLEELEMGLHPRAIGVVLLLVLELLVRGYRVCLSTHSPQVLDAVWALKHLKANNAGAQAILGVFEAENTQSMRKLADTAMEKSLKVFYFDRETGKTRDISELARQPRRKESPVGVGSPNLVEEPTERWRALLQTRNRSLLNEFQEGG
ncbi:MAG TPA: AAA family ATPase [Candidatus Angelobacter sp.]|nr:AAA family ATPase [Candidatus Angelobacter sp.]